MSGAPLKVPVWEDVGRPLVAKLVGGYEVRGTLYVEDVFFDDEGECPMFVVDCDDGKVRSFYDLEWFEEET